MVILGNTTLIKWAPTHLHSTLLQPYVPIPQFCLVIPGNCCKHPYLAAYGVACWISSRICSRIAHWVAFQAASNCVPECLHLLLLKWPFHLLTWPKARSYAIQFCKGNSTRSVSKLLHAILQYAAQRIRTAHPAYDLHSRRWIGFITIYMRGDEQTSWKLQRNMNEILLRSKLWSLCTVQDIAQRERGTESRQQVSSLYSERAGQNKQENTSVKLGS